MSDINDPPPSPETPWEFLPDDDIRDELAKEELPPAEADAMHVETAPPPPESAFDLTIDKPPAKADEVVHYFPDEHPEVPDRSEPRAVAEETPEVEDLLIRQHYLPADDQPDDDGAADKD